MLVDELINQKVISADKAGSIRRAVTERPEDEEKILLEEGVKFEDILRARKTSPVPKRSLTGAEIPFDVLQFVPEESALYYKILPLALRKGVLEVGIVNPENIEARDAISFLSARTGLPVKLYSITEAEFGKAAAAYRGLSGEVTAALSELESELAAETVKKEEVKIGKPPAGGLETRVIEDAPVTKIVATVLHYAVEGDASDIHIEPMDDKVRVRFRVDGVLNTSLILPTKVHPAVVARIKILANIRLDEKRKPQDGRFSARIEGRRIDFRVSTFPAYYGEKIEMRILDPERGVRRLEKLGLSGRNLQLIREAIKRPYGLILMSGPTGSGKTTTLYSMLNEIDRDHRNVLSLEDPVEYNIPGMSQSQVRPEIGYSFATGLRTTLRQDPDIIMVGEIRDKETAALAVQAALTGHLVLSTIHTNNAVGVIPRLIDMGVDPYLIAPTLILAMAQRLVVTLCPGAEVPVPIEGSIKMLIDKTFEDLPAEHRREINLGKHLYKAGSTPDCPKGTRGRMAVFEVLEMNKEIEEILLKDPSELSVRRAARRQGMLTMKEDAILKCSQKEIPFEEVNKL
ncbi:MAG: type II/IV secretion system protein [Candidatus Taylorbacteria bacterium]|nr:type II/IV secretion system protein [Candidatus Taylorbacteria bacterium]